MRKSSLVCAGALLSGVAFSQQLVVNGQFSTGDLGGWTVEQDGTGSQGVGPQSEGGDPGNDQYTAGSARFSWYSANQFTHPDNIIYQTIPTVVGAKYTIVLNWYHRASFDAGNLDVWWNTSSSPAGGGNVFHLGSQAAEPVGFWVQLSANVVATRAATIFGVGANYEPGIEISDIGVAAVPEPPSIAAFGVGTLALTRCRRRKTTPC